MDFVAARDPDTNAEVKFRYYDHLLESIAPQGGHLQGGTSAELFGRSFHLLSAVQPEAVNYVRCRFGTHDPIPATIDTDAITGAAYIKCASSNSEVYGRIDTGYEFVAVAINAYGQFAGNFLPTLEGANGCIANEDKCAKFKYYTESVFSLWPVSGPVVGGSDVTISGLFSPGYDGVRTSARCLFKQRGVSTLTQLEPTSVQCPSLPIPAQGNQTHYAYEMGVALNGAYIDDDSSDYVSIRAMCPPGAVSNYQRFVQYTQRVDAIDPTGGPTEGGTVVTVRGAGFLPIDTPDLVPPLLAPSARCLWQCTPRPDNPQQCQEGGEESEPVMTRPTRVTPTEIVCASPARLGLGARFRARVRLRVRVS